jgi:hypothetical protein
VRCRLPIWFARLPRSSRRRELATHSAGGRGRVERLLRIPEQVAQGFTEVWVFKGESNRNRARWNDALESRLGWVVLVDGIIAAKAVVTDGTRSDENPRRTRESPAEVHQGSRCGDPTVDELPATRLRPRKSLNRRSRQVDYSIDEVVRVQFRRRGDDANLRAEAIEGTTRITCQHNNAIATCQQASDELTADEARATAHQHGARVGVGDRKREDRVAYPLGWPAEAKERAHDLPPAARKRPV